MDFSVVLGIIALNLILILTILIVGVVWFLQIEEKRKRTRQDTSLQAFQEMAEQDVLHLERLVETGDVNQAVDAYRRLTGADAYSASDAIEHLQQWLSEADEAVDLRDE